MSIKAFKRQDNNNNNNNNNKKELLNNAMIDIKESILLTDHPNTGMFHAWLLPPWTGKRQGAQDTGNAPEVSITQTSGKMYLTPPAETAHKTVSVKSMHPLISKTM